MEGFVSETYKNTTVVLDTKLSEELIEEGFVREIISKIQTMRKEANFEVLDRIEILYKANEKIANIIAKNMENIKEDVLADSLLEGEKEGYSKEWNINGENVLFTVLKK